MQTDNQTLIQELLNITDSATASALKFKGMSESQLNYKKDAEKWSVLECLEHLNRYGDYYLPEIEKTLLSDKARNGDGIFRSGTIGNYFANLMKVKNGKMFKMKTPGDKNPSGSNLTTLTIDRFLKQQEMLKSLLIQAQNADLTRAKVPVSIAKFLKIRLGDTFRFFIYHIERHIFQAERAAEMDQ